MARKRVLECGTAGYCAARLGAPAPPLNPILKLGRPHRNPSEDPARWIVPNAKVQGPRRPRSTRGARRMLKVGALVDAEDSLMRRVRTPRSDRLPLPGPVRVGGCVDVLGCVDCPLLLAAYLGIGLLLFLFELVGFLDRGAELVPIVAGHAGAASP